MGSDRGHPVPLVRHSPAYGAPRLPHMAQVRAPSPLPSAESPNEFDLCPFVQGKHQDPCFLQDTWKCTVD